MGSRDDVLYRSVSFVVENPVNGREEFEAEGGFKPRDQIDHTFETLPGFVATFEEPLPRLGAPVHGCTPNAR